MEKNKIGDYIKRKRKEKGYSQQELGKLLFVTDKAVSKWERNIGLPDVAILTKLAKALDTTVSNILNGEDNTKDIDIDDKLKELKKEINSKNRMKIIGIIILSLLVIIIVITNNISYGYRIKQVHYNHAGIKKDINVGIPKTSFMMKYNDKSYSFKNFRNKSVLENEIKKYLKTLKYLSCNDTIYYYNETDDFSITAYSVDNYILYKNITYTIANGDYCNSNKLNEYSEKLGGLKRFHSMNDKYSFYDSWNNLLSVLFQDGYSDDNNSIYEFKAKLKIQYLTRIDSERANYKILEESIGDYEIKDDKLYYYRTKIIDKSDDVNIPEVSVFKIEDQKLLLIDNYLEKYYDKQIVLK